VRRTATDVPVVAVGAVALVLRVGYLVAFTASKPLNSDAQQFSSLASNLAHGHGLADIYPQLSLHATAFRPPLYPMVLALFYRVFGASPGLGRGLNVAIGVLAVCVTVVVVRRHLSTVAGVAAGLAMAVSPNLVANSTFTLSEPLGTILLVLLLDVVARRRWVWSGVLLGLLLLTRPSTQPLAVILLVWVVVACWRRWREMLAFVVPLVLVLAPWFVRNWVQLGSPVYVTSNGYNMAAAYGPPAQRTGTFNDPLFDPYYDFMRLDQFDEVKWSSHLQRIGIDALRANPGYVFHVLEHNGGSYFELTPSVNTPAERLDGRDLAVRRDTLWLFYLSLPLGVAGLALGLARRDRLGTDSQGPDAAVPRHGRTFVVLVAIEGVAFTAASVLLISAPRLREPFDVAMAIGIGILADHLWTLRNRRRRPPSRLPSPTS
jgi:4-amino-4-deoxy-L-arabinose transferase-like glycosyltransferase